jgi:predicted MFS family arabinose efflux permease
MVALLSAASVATDLAIKAMLITATVVAFVLMMRADRRATAPLLPSDAFSLRSRTGAGLWMILLMSVGYSPLAIYAPLFLQRLHGVSPLGAGYMIALASLAWTTAALAVASLSDEWPPRLIIMGPSAMGAGLAGVGVLMAPGPVTALILPIVLIGVGIGAAWAFVLQRVMIGAKNGEENIAAASAATVQQAGIALGAAIAGLVANASGLDDGLDPGSILRASFWVPLALVAAPLAASVIGVRLNLMAPRSPAQRLTAAGTVNAR